MVTYDARDHLDELTEYGCHILVNIEAEHLDAFLRISNAALWRVPELDFEQGCFQHQGFDGCLRLLLGRVHAEVLEARSRYPEEKWKDFDAFLMRVEDVLAGAGKNTLRLEVRDPSGLSHVAASLAPTVVAFERSVREDWALGIDYPRPAVQRSDAKSVARLVQKSSRIVALTGAGISVESGVTPFRTSTGGDAIWAEFDPNSMTVGNFNSDQKVQEATWCMTRKFDAELLLAPPNPAHIFFARLQEQKKLRAVVTQNIDSLHQKAGVPEEKVHELHGHHRSVICAANRTRLNPEPFGDGTCDFACNMSDVSERDAVPLCPKCSAPLRTETVMFEQAMPSGAVESATQAVKEADLLIVVGSTLIVAPANELPAEAIRRGIPVVLVNFDETRYDNHVTVLVRRPAGELFAEVAAILKAGVDDEDEEDRHVSMTLESQISMVQACPEDHLDTQESSDEEQLYGDDDIVQ